MKLYNKLTIFLLLFIMLLPIINAVSPFQESTDIGTLTISIPKTGFLKQYETPTMHIHVFNSTGSLMTGDYIDCYVHIYNRTNSEIVNENMSYDADGDFTINVSSVVTNNTGIYSYIAWCNGTQNGFISTTFQVTKYGDDPNSYKQLYFILILFVIAFILLKLFAIIDEKHFLLKLIIFFFLIPVLILLARNSMNLNEMGLSVYKGMMWFIRCVFFYIAGYFIYETLKWQGILSNDKPK